MSKINRIQLKRTKNTNNISGGNAMELYVGEPALVKTNSKPMLVVGRPENTGEGPDQKFKPTTSITEGDVTTTTNNWCWFLGKETEETLLNEAVRSVSNNPSNTETPTVRYLTTEADYTKWISPAIYTPGVNTSENADNIYYLAITPDNSNSANGILYRDPTIYVKNGVMYGAAWNDYAESRLVQTDAEAGQCVIEVGNGTMIVSSDYLQPAGSVISDTYGHMIGPKTKDYKAIAVSGRVLAYVDESKGILEAGDAVMTAPNGKVAKMTRRQIKKYPDRIVGIVSEIPTYEVWNNKVEVKGRVWIRVR